MRKGQKMSEEQKRKIGNANRGVWIEKECETCGEKFEYPIREKNRKYCSMPCYRISSKGTTPWNKNKPWSEEAKRKMSLSHKTSEKAKRARKILHQNSKGKHYSPATEFKKGDKPTTFKGRTKHSQGYICIYKPNHPYSGKRKNVLEHRLVIEKHIRRYLLPKERGHHLDGNKSNNHHRNLMAFINQSAHQRFHCNPDNVKPEEIVFDGRKI